MENKTTFWKFIQNNKIEIPIIQRDYAQGREGKEYIRNTFLETLKKALDSDEQLKLDFVYGSQENESINPLDGQQRLTTLWLLHWYIALKAGQLTDDVAEILNNFSYETRISSREFCQELCNTDNFKKYEAGSVVDFIQRQTWFYSAWKQDPTIQAMLRMLKGTKISDKKGNDICDGIEEFFATTSKETFETYWKKLTESEVIIFYYLPLQDFGLSDDLYIKMNARGKQLTSFENFKADLIGYIEQKAKEDKEWEKFLDTENGIPIKLDTTWTDIFWKNRSEDNRIDEIYFAFFNRFFWNELFIAKHDDKYLLDIGKGDESSTQENENKSYYYLNDSKNSGDFDVKIAYTYFDVYKYFNGDIPLDFFSKLSSILYRYRKIENFPVCNWNKNFHFIPIYEKNDKEENIEIENNSNENILKVSSLNQVERIVFYAVCEYLNDDEYEEVSFKRWMRVVWNLISGEDESGRPEIRSTQAVRTAIKFIGSLESHNVYSSLKYYQVISGDSSFDERCKEEIEKARQILNDKDELRKYDGTCKKEDGTEFDTWEDVVIEAESYAFFKGAIRFLFQDEKGEVNENSWEQFDTKWENAKKYFKESCDDKVQSVLNDEYDNANLLKALISNFNDDNFEAVLCWRHRVFNNKIETWRYYLLNREICSAVYKLLMGQNKIKEREKNSGNVASERLWQLSNTDLLDYVIKNIPNSWIRWYHNHMAIFPSAQGVFLNADKRNRFLLHTEGITINNEAVVPNTDFLFGSDIDFEYKYKTNTYLMNWYRNDYIYLKEKGDYKIRNTDGKTEEEKYYCFKVENDMNENAIIDSIKKLIEVVDPITK